MGAFSVWHWLIVLAVVVVLFGGGGKISQLMGDFGKGLKVFKKNIKDDERPGERISDENDADARKESSSEETTR